MGQANYRVVLTGTVVDKFAHDDVIQTAIKIFKCDEHQAKKLLGRKPTPLKRLMDLETAERYRDRLLKSGIDCKVQTLEPDTVALTMDPPPPVNRHDASSAQSPKAAAKQTEAKPTTAPVPATRLTLELVSDKATATVTANSEAGFSCPKCFTPQTRGVECIHCGVIFAKLQPASVILVATDQGDSEQDQTLEEEDEFGLFVGDNFEKYRLIFDDFKNNDDKFVLQWHWAACMVPIPWMIYRKLYLWAAGFFLITAVLPFYGSAVLSLVSGLGANYVYYRLAKKRIETIHSSGEDRRVEIILAGGTNSMLVTIGITTVASIIMATILYTFYFKSVLNNI